VGVFIFIHMGDIKHDVKVLRKLLNSPLFLGKYPMINRVWVEEYGTDKIDIILNVNEPADEYWPIRDEIKSFIWNIAKMSGVTSRFNIYP
jgi:hypothetical protein